ncbi:putative esterase [Mycobacterium sp. JS623]|nr:putative esterase [Mycobacterium sp. JS623]
MCQHWDVSAHAVVCFVGSAVVTTWAALCAPFAISSAFAAACPDVEVVFARATTEPPGVGQVGQAFVDSLRSQVGGRSVAVYPVDYPATEDFANSASAGADNARAHVESTVTNCPNTRIVLGGYSQGALTIDLITAIPVSFAGFTPAPMPPELANHVAAVVVFGNPMDRYVGAPLTAVSPLYADKAIDLCAAGDPICSPGGGMSAPTHDEMFSDAHLSYVRSGMASQGATFATGRVSPAGM